MSSLEPKRAAALLTKLMNAVDGEDLPSVGTAMAALLGIISLSVAQDREEIALKGLDAMAEDARNFIKVAVKVSPDSPRKMFFQ